MGEATSLLRLQEVDLQLMRDNRKLHAMPQQKKLAAINQAKRKLQAQLTQVKGQRKDCEIEMEELETKYQGYIEKRADAQARAHERETTYRQIGDIEAQLTALAKGMEKAEFRHGQLQEQLDKAKKAEANGQALLAKLDQEAEAQQASFEADTADIMAEVRRLADERKHLQNAISPEMMDRYDKVGKRYNGLAVERLEPASGKGKRGAEGRDYVPSLCRVKLQASQVGDIRRSGRAVVECPYCHRILVAEGAFADGD